MRFMIHGADQKTGREMTVVMEAPDESEAERRALYNDILVSSVARFAAGAAASGGGAEDEARGRVAETGLRRTLEAPLPYHPREFAPEERGGTPPNPAAAVPGYRDVLHGARWLDRLGRTARWGGAAAVLAGVTLILVALVDPFRQRLALPDEPVLFLAAAAVLAVLGVLCLVCGVLVSMTSGLVVAVRDIAQNTFHVATLPNPVNAVQPSNDEAPVSASRMWVTSGPVVTTSFRQDTASLAASRSALSLPR